MVLFRYGSRIVGEAVVSRGKEVFPEPIKDRTLTGEEEEYGARVTFDPGSIRLYAPALSVGRIQPYVSEKDIQQYAGAYTLLGWETYGAVLQEVVSNGTSIT